MDCSVDVGQNVRSLIITVLEGRYFEGFWLEKNELVSQGVEC